MEGKNYYLILGVEKDASEDEIKKSYKKLALKYHPDKNIGNDESIEKFKEISEAYSVLGNKEKRNQYDVMGNIDDNFMGEDPFSVFNSIFQQHINSFMNMKYEKDINIGGIFTNMSGFSEENFPFGNVHVRVHTFPTDEEENINENIFDKLFTKKNKFVKNIKKGKPDDIVYDVTVSLSDIYNENKKKMSISRMRKKDGKYIDKKKKIEIPLYGKEILLEGEGHEMKDYSERGNIIINIFNTNEDNFKRVNDYDVLTYQDIHINQIYNSFIYEIILPHGEVIIVQSEMMVGKTNLIQKILKKGLPYMDDNNVKCYGNLYVVYKLILPNNFEDLKNIEQYIEESGINENYNIAYNCDFNELFRND